MSGRTWPLTWCVDIGHFWGEKKTSFEPVTCRFGSLFCPPDQRKWRSSLTAPCIHIEDARPYIMSQKDQLQSKPLSWWQHNPFFTGHSSSSCVLVDWLYLIKLPTRCSRRPRTETPIRLFEWTGSLCATTRPDCCDVWRSQISERYHSCSELIQGTDFNDAGWSTKQAEPLGPQGGRRRPRLKSDYVTGVRRRLFPFWKYNSTGKSFPVSRNRQVLWNPTTSWGAEKQSRRWRSRS